MLRCGLLGTHELQAATADSSMKRSGHTSDETLHRSKCLELRTSWLPRSRVMVLPRIGYDHW